MIEQSFNLKTEISYRELIDTYTPIWDVSNMLRLQSDDLFGEVKDKLERAKAPLFKLIQKIENDNPEHFS